MTKRLYKYLTFVAGQYTLTRFTHMPPNPEQFLPEKYADLPGSKPVERAVQKNLREGEAGPSSKGGRVQAYLDRLENLAAYEHELASGQTISGWDHLKAKIIKEFAIDTDDQDTLAKIAHGLYESEKKLAVEQGRGADVARLEQETESEGGVLERYQGLVHEKRDIQEKTLTSWLDYLKQNDAQYPTWFRYFVVRNLQKMGTIDKERGEYSKRTPLTVAPFPELNSEALGFVYRMLTTGIGNKEFTEPDDQPKRQELEALINKKDFARLYTFAQIETAGKLNRESIQGQWVKYEQGSDHHALEDSLRGKGTGWCTAEGSAYSHLQGGDFYVYYTKGADKKYTEPRVAIRMEGDQVAEVRGVNHRQELEPALLDIATEQYHSLPGGEKFDKKSADMKYVTALVAKQEKGVPFIKDDLIFLYELNQPIEGFGYDKDPRIQELRSQRNSEQDMPIIFGCEPRQIAHRVSEIHPDTRAYVGPLENGIFDLVQQYQIEHIYTSFPERKIRTYEIYIGGKDKDKLKHELVKKNIYVSEWARDLMASQDFTTLTNTEQAKLARLTAADLGFTQGATTPEIYQKAQKLGLELCPAEVGPNFRLQYEGKGWILIAMRQIADRDGVPMVFRLGSGGGLLGLIARSTEPGLGWFPVDEWLFRLRKLLKPLKT